MIEYAATLYTGMLYAGLVIAVIFAAYLVLTTWEDRKRGLVASTGHGGENAPSLTPEHGAMAGRERPVHEETPRRGAA
jgi:hypothetical protein